MRNEFLAVGTMMLLALAACSRAASVTAVPVAATHYAALPEGWIPAETWGAGTPAKWQTLVEIDKSSHLCVAAANGDDTFNLLLSKGAFGPDVDIAVRLRADGGEIDCGGGLVWRAKDADNYYVTRWNPLENNLRLYKVVEGARTKLVSVDTLAAASAWHDLRVTMIGASIVVVLDGDARLELEDATFGDAGSVGLWTKADASTSFSVPEIRTLPRAGNR